MATGKRSAAVLGIVLCLTAGNAVAAEKKPVLPSSPQEVAERLLRMNAAGGWSIHVVMDVLKGIMDKRFSCLRSNASGNRDRGWTLRDDVVSLTLGTGGPGEFVEVEGRYVIGWSCRTHSCFEKGLTVFDTAQNDFVFALRNYFPWDSRHTKGNGAWSLSIFVPPRYPSADYGGLEKVASDWIRAETGTVPPIQFHTVDCRVPKSLPGR